MVVDIDDSCNARLLNPSSELYIAEPWYSKTALPDLLGVPADRVDDNRLYRALDELFPPSVDTRATNVATAVFIDPSEVVGEVGLA